MMEGIAAVAGVGPMITLGGHTFQTSTRILRHYAHIQAEMLKQRINPFSMIRMLAAEMPDRQDLAQIAVSSAFNKAMDWGWVSEPDMFDWMQNTTHGRITTVFLAVEGCNEPKPTFDQIRKLYCDEWDDVRVRDGVAAAERWALELFDRIAQATGSDEVGNSSGSPSSTAAGESESREKTESPGTTSTRECESDTTGPEIRSTECQLETSALK